MSSYIPDMNLTIMAIPVNINPAITFFSIFLHAYNYRNDPYT